MKKRTILIFAVSALIIGGLGWYFLKDDPETMASDSPQISNFEDCSKAGGIVMETFPEQCVINGNTYTREVPASAAASQQYLVIKEWDVQVPISKETNTDDMAYVYKKNDTSEAITFTFERLKNYGICLTDVGVAVTRSTTKNNPPYDIENPEQFAKVGNYYYSFAYGGAPCYNQDDPQEVAFYESTGITKNTVTDAVKKIGVIN